MLNIINFGLAAMDLEADSYIRKNFFLNKLEQYIILNSKAGGWLSFTKIKQI